MSEAAKPAEGYGEFTGVGSTDQTPWEEARAALSALVSEAQREETEIAALTKQIEEKTAKMNGILQRTLPEQMKKAGVFEEGFTTVAGSVVKGKSDITTSVLKDNRGQAYDWLEANGHKDIVKNEVSIAFAVGEGEKAAACAKALQAEHNRTVSAERKVEAPTLKKTIKDILESNKDKAAKGEAIVEVPKELFGVREFDTVTIKAPKES
jgi:hypothetical protein